MKKIFSILLAAATMIGTFTSCEDVPMPYDINDGTTTFGKKLPYKNASLSSFSMYDTKGLAAWSQGSSYTQATGYQKWDGSDTKSNKEVESYLISPALNTTCASGKVRFYFDNTIRYENKVTDWQKYHKIYISKDYSGNSTEFDKATWTEIAFTPKASTTNDWTLYTSGQIAIPEEFVNHDSVYIAFYFYAPAENSTTWELENFLIEEGEADNTNTDGDKTETTAGTKEAPITVAEAKTKTGAKVYLTGYIVGYVDGQKLEEGAKFEAATGEAQTELLLADAADCSDVTLVMPIQLPSGDIRTKLSPNIAENIGKKVVLYGTVENYFGTPGLKSTSWALIDGTEVGKDPEAEDVPLGDAKGTGTVEDPYNVAAAINIAKELGSGNTSEKEVYIKGKVSRIQSIETEKYQNATFFISEDGSQNNEFEAYQVYGLGNQKITDANYVKVGDEVILYGKITNYMGNTYETTGKGTAYIYSLNGKTEGGTTTGDDDNNDKPSTSEGVTIDGTTVTLTNSAVTAGTESITVDLNTLGYTNQQEITNIDLSDGSKITFDKGTNNNAPKFYEATKGIRVYGSNIITFEGKAPIANIVITCDEYNGTKYVGQTTATIEVDGNKMVYTNAGSGTTQLRVQTITITYAASSAAKARR
ncbi:MAG: DUF5017 domain-containing protein [Bacteroidaceae bacterium]|nr:DUF5017 domain-containing protein [Bacteroidaceae bacterium]